MFILSVWCVNVEDSLLYLTTDAVVWTRVDLNSSTCCQSYSALHWVGSSSVKRFWYLLLFFLLLLQPSVLSLCYLSVITACFLSLFLWQHWHVSHCEILLHSCFFFACWEYCKNLNMMVYVLSHAKKNSINLRVKISLCLLFLRFYLPYPTH